MRGATANTKTESETKGENTVEWIDLQPTGTLFPSNIFDDPSLFPQQLLIDAIIEATIFEGADRKTLRNDPLVRLLIRNPPGQYNFVIVSAAGVITEGMSLTVATNTVLYSL